MRTHAHRLIALGVVALLAAPVAPVRPAIAAEPPTLRILQEGALRASGAGAVVAVRLSCPAGLTHTNVHLDVRQTTTSGELVRRFGHRQVHGCTTQPQRFLVPIAAADRDQDTAAFRFRAGSAAVFAEHSNCDDEETPCLGAWDLATVDLTDRDDMDRRSAITPSGDTIKLWHEVGLTADGALVRPRYTYSCRTPGRAPSIDVRLSQKVRGGFALSDRPRFQPSVVCDGQQHAVRARLQALDFAFRVGPAFELVEFYSCDESRCSFDRVWGEVEAVTE